MLQIATFSLPGQQEEANEFLKTHKPDGSIHFNTNMVVVFFDDGVVPPAWQISDLQEMLRGQSGAKLQQEIALHTLSTQLADLKSEKSHLNVRHNKGRYEEVDNLISQIEKAIAKTKEAIALQGVKEEFVKQRIAELQRA